MESKDERVFEIKRSRYFWTIASKNLSKFAAQRRVRKNNEVALNIIFNGLSYTVKESMGLCTSAKDLWLKLEKVYQIKREDTKDIPIKDEKEDSAINEGKYSPQYSDCNNVDVECSPASKEEDSDTIEESFVSIYPMEEVEEELSKIKRKLIGVLLITTMTIVIHTIAIFMSTLKNFLKRIKSISWK
jgi:hypothetical protein